MTNKIFTYITTATLLALLTIGSASANRTYGPIKKKDYLGTIIKKTYPKSKLKPQQTMVAILRANPDAFKGHNIHYIKTGFTLTLPSEEVIKTIDNNEALAIIEKHYKSFKRGKTGNFTLKALPTIKTETTEPVDVAKTVEGKQEQEPTQNNVSIENKSDTEEITKSEPTNKSELANTIVEETDSSPEKTTEAATPESKLAINDEKNLANKKTNHTYDKLDSLENIRSQQNKTIDILDQQISEIESQINQNNQRDKNYAQLDSQSNVEPKELDEDATIEGSAINPDTEAPKDDTKNITDSQQSSNKVPLQDTDNLSQPWQLAILLGVLSLLGFIAYRAFRKPAIEPRNYSSAINNPESLKDAASGLAIETHSVLSAQTTKEASQTHEDTELKINMAKAYIDMGYIDAATEVLEEARQESSQQQQDIIDKIIKNI